MNCVASSCCSTNDFRKQSSWNISITQSHLALPNELLLYIADYIAYSPIPPRYPPSISPFRCVSPELFALSLADWRLRQVCVPFLFANIKIRHDRDAERLEENVALFSRFAKILVLDGPLSATVNKIMVRILSRLERLFYVEVKDCQKRTPQLFNSILAHPIVKSVLVHELPPQSMQKGDLSKVTLNDKTLRSRIPLDFMKCLRHGMRVANLLLFSSEILGTLNLGTVSGLETIHVGMDRDSISLFWTVLLSTPSNIKEVWFFDKKGLHDVGYTPPFMESFIEESKRQGLNESFNITAVGLGRATGHSHQWDIVNLSFRSTTSLLPTLALAASLFPKLEVLTLNLSEHEGTYDIVGYSVSTHILTHIDFLWLRLTLCW
ncbi:hypothetical protein F5880DRAFT_324809 [Lentinula raphanica]|nr:hypothetical protein F5880DRAFT_324809 [Lentinula raphanica]